MIQVIDCGPGSGKTTWACQYMNLVEKKTPIIYVTLYNDECARIINAVKNRKMESPRKNKKHIDFEILTREGKSFVATHSLFSDATSEIMDNIKKHKYILILDEVITVLNKYVPLYCREYNSKIKDPNKYLQIQFETKFIYVDKKTNLVKWNNDYPVNPLDDSMVQLKDLCDRDLLYSINDNNGKSVVMWTFPHRLFNNCFSKIYILTHLFDYQIQKYYFDVFNIPYKKFHIECENPNDEYEKRVYYPAFTASNQHELEWRKKIKNLIIFEDRKQYTEKGNILDYNGKPLPTALSDNWYSHTLYISKAERQNLAKENREYEAIRRNDTAKKYFDELKKALISFYRKHNYNKVLFTCYRGKEDVYIKNYCDGKYLRYRQVVPSKDDTATKGIMPAFISLNMRATNKFSTYKAFAYMINRYISPVHDNFFKMMGIKIDYEKIALAELIQLLLRTRLRNGETLHLFIPSIRMRRILENYLNGKDDFSAFSTDSDICYDDSIEDEIDETA